MAVELRNTLCQQFNCALAPTLLFDYPTIDAIVQFMADQVLDIKMGRTESSEFSEDTKDALDDEMSYLKEISDADAEALLMEELKRLGKDD